MDYDDDRYYIANNMRNTQYAMNPNPSTNYVQKPISPTMVATAPNYPSTANRYVSHPKHATIASPTVDPRQDVGLPRSSIVWFTEALKADKYLLYIDKSIQVQILVDAINEFSIFDLHVENFRKSHPTYFRHS